MSMVDKNDVQGPQKNLLGHILLKRGLVTKEQLDKALDVQSRQEKKQYLGQTLIQLGFVEERDIVVALVVQCNLPYIAIDKYSVDKNIAHMIPEEFARENLVVPLDRVGDILSVVMADPLDQSVKAQLKRITHCAIAPFIATQQELINALDRCYPKE